MADFADLTSRVVNGAVAGNLTVTGIQKNDQLVIVQDLSGTAPANLSSEFTVTADNTINNTGGTSTSGHLVLVMWMKRYTGGRHKFETGQRQGRFPYT
jgi:hypothetical protein